MNEKVAEPDYTYARASYDAFNKACNAPNATPFDEIDLASKVVWHKTAAAARVHVYGLFTHKQIGNLFSLYCHAKKRLKDEFGIELDEDWETRVAGGEHDVPFPDTADLEYNKMRRALNNVRMVAARLLNKERKMVTSIAVTDLEHILRFCAEAGEAGSVLRDGTCVDA